MLIDTDRAARLETVSNPATFLGNCSKKVLCQVIKVKQFYFKIILLNLKQNKTKEKKLKTVELIN